MSGNWERAIDNWAPCWHTKSNKNMICKCDKQLFYCKIWIWFSRACKSWGSLLQYEKQKKLWTANTPVKEQGGGPSFCVQNSNFGNKDLKWSSRNFLPLAIYSKITPSIRIATTQVNLKQNQKTWSGIIIGKKTTTPAPHHTTAPGMITIRAVLGNQGS